MNSKSFNTRAIIAAGLLVSVVAVTAAAGVYLAQDSEPSLRIDSVNTSDTAEIGRATTLTVTLTNTGETPVNPKFKVIHSTHQTRTYWDIVDGPETLSSGEQATYQVRAPNTQATIPYNAEATLSVNDNGTQEQVVYGPFSPTEPAGLSRPIFNPDFEYWLLESSGTPVPFRWSYQTTVNEAVADINQPDKDTVQLSVSNDTRPPEGGPWTISSVVQSVSVPDQITITASTSAPAKAAVKYPSRAAGIELAEGNHRIWLVLADISSKTTVTRKSGNLSYAIVYVPAEPNEEVTATVDVDEIYAKQGWTYPEREEVRIDGVTYYTRSSLLRGFVALYPSADVSNASVTIDRIKAE